MLFSTDKICAFFLAWKFDPSIAIASDTTKSYFQLAEENSKSEHVIKTPEQVIKSRVLKKTESFVKDWEVRIVIHDTV